MEESKKRKKISAFPDEKDLDILKFLGVKSSQGTIKLAEKVELAPKNLIARLKKLEMEGFIKKEKIGTKPKGWKRVWKITPQGNEKIKEKRFVSQLNVEIIGIIIKQVNSKEDHKENLSTIISWVNKLNQLKRKSNSGLNPFFIEIEFGFRFKFAEKYLTEYVKIIKDSIKKDYPDLPINYAQTHYKNDQELLNKLELLNQTYGDNWVTDGIINLSIYYK